MRSPHDHAGHRVAHAQERGPRDHTGAVVHPGTRLHVDVVLADAGDPARAFGILARALSLDPTNPSLYQGALELAKAAGAVDRLAHALRRTAAVAEDVGASLYLWRELARLLGSPLSRPEQAEAAWREVLRRSPEDADAQSALQALAEAQRVDAPERLRQQREAEATRLEEEGTDPEPLLPDFMSESWDRIEWDW